MRLRRRTFEPIGLFAIALATATLAYTSLLVQLGTPFGPVWAILALAALAAFVERQPVRLTSNLEITVSFLPLVFAAFAALALDLPAATIVAVLGLAWYGSEMALAAAAGWPLPLLHPVHTITRDLLLPVLWVKGFSDRAFVGRGKQMHVDDADDVDRTETA